MQAFWFCREDRKLDYKDGRSVRVGSTHKVKGALELCANGLHASVRLIDALKYTPGPVLYLVEMGGDILTDADKVCARERKYRASFNAEKLLRKFARKQASIHIEKIKPYTNQYELIIQWLETGDESIRSAAESAAESAARSAARSAAELAARSAARYAAESAARSATESAANEMLTRMVREETGWDI